MSRDATTAFARTLVDEWVRHGVTDACVAPGSRSAPLALALASDDRVRLHVHLDERSAAFFALGLARASGRPAPVLCTSGTPAANFHPAVLEAHHARVPLIACTADRPPELRDTGAGQTVKALTPDDVSRLKALPQVARADGDVAGFGMSLLAGDGTLVGGTGAPTLAFNHTDGPNMDGERALLLTSGRWPERSGEIVLDDGAADAGDYRVGDQVKLLAPFGTLERTAELVGTAEFNGGGTAGATLLVFTTQEAQALFLGGMEKGEFLRAFGADVFFDDQRGHCDSASRHVATGHVPHGVANIR